MDFPIYIQIGNSRILLHAVTELLAFFVGFRYYVYLRKKNGDQINSVNRIWVIIGAILGALLGSRLIGGLENPAGLAAAENKLAYFYVNKTVLGGFLGGLLGVEAIKKMIGEKTSSGDLFVYPIFLALIIGRIGCFSMGIFEETYGKATHLFTGIDLGDGIKRHPVALYEIVFIIVLWTGIQWIERRSTLVNGGRFKIFMIMYCLFRLVLDFIKPHYDIITGLSTIQLTAIAGLLYYSPYIVNYKKLCHAGTPVHVL